MVVVFRMGILRFPKRYLILPAPNEINETADFGVGLALFVVVLLPVSVFGWFGSEMMVAMVVAIPTMINTIHLYRQFSSKQIRE